ncbi:carbamoyltransferase [Pedobacter agri]|uniref:carbamoyltransferase family protein n=1 Tax=Pedobacter agri TaxID=454586 RepID=UPI002931653F|nr:carbamoyltransferase C-terminal domain-containing protein [Pedobacter agri]
MYIIGIGGLLGHDANVALFKNDQLVASSQEERFTFEKHDYRFPINAINDCLSLAGITNDDIAICIFAEKPFFQSVFNYTKKQPSFFTKLIQKVSHLFEKTLFEKEAQKLFKNAAFKYSWHHASHVAAAFHSANLKESVFLCVDGKSENTNASIGYISNRELIFERELEYENGLGMFYTFVTHYLGFTSFGSEYKVMGLAPYGQPNYVEQLYKLGDTNEKGSFKMKFDPGFNPTATHEYFYLIEKATGVPRATKNAELSNEQVDVAASLQRIFEIELLKMASYAKSIYPSVKNLIFCGGCAQNCVTAGIIRDSEIFEYVFNSPIGGDMGSAIGACMVFMREHGLSTPNFYKKNFYFGSPPGQLTVEEALQHEVAIEGDIFTETAKLLAQGYICGWVQNGMELGARALGARSILANPVDPEMQTKLNLKIKFRESFRPFAPIILEAEQANWFDTQQPSYYMQYTAYLKQHLRYKVPSEFKSFKAQLNYPRCVVPSIVHVDFSARLQTISSEVHTEMHRLLEHFFKLTGVPILINTSFNVNGQPIVRTANDAWNCFVHTDIDYLIIENKLYKHPKNLSQEQKVIWLNSFEKHSK